MAVFLGIDGGGTKTTAIAANENGKVLAKAVGGSINYNSVGMATARQNLQAVVDELCTKTNEQSFKAACIGSSALASRANQRQTLAFTGGIIDAEQIVMDSDVFAAMECLFETGPRAVVISGTGSMVAAIDENNKYTHAGGWGYILGDEGSGFCIAYDAVRYAIRAYEGSEPKTALLGEMLDYFECGKPEELIEKFYNPIIERSKLSAFASRVFSCANAGDEAAKSIVCNQAMLLAETAKSLLVDFPIDTAIGLWGGVFVNNRLFRNEFAIRMFEQSDEYRIRLLNYPAECGALFAAYKMSGVELGKELMKNIDVYRGVRV